MSDIDLLSAFRTINPGQFISKYSDWILFTLLIFFFWSVVNLALRKHFENSRAFRFLATSTALMLAVGTYYLTYLGKLHLSLAGLGLFGAILILIIIFFILFSLHKHYGLKTSISLPIGFVLFYISIFAVTPNVMDNLNDIFPLAKPIMAILFAVSLLKILTAFFRHTNPSLRQAAKNLKSMSETINGEPDINKEIRDDKREEKLLKKQTMKLTKAEIRTIEDMQNFLVQMINLIKDKGNTLSQDETYQIGKILRNMGEKESLIVGAMPTLKKHAEFYKKHHRKDISELEKRLRDSINNPKQQNRIREEIGYQKRMLEILDFIEEYENKILGFAKGFSQKISTGIQKLKSHYPKDCLEYLEFGKKELDNIKHILKKQNELEAYVLKINKKTVKNLKKEKDNQNRR